jgi:hypothetical protein
MRPLGKTTSPVTGKTKTILAQNYCEAERESELTGCGDEGRYWNLYEVPEGKLVKIGGLAPYGPSYYNSCQGASRRDKVDTGGDFWGMGSL